MKNKTKLLVIGIIIAAIIFGVIMAGIILGGFSSYKETFQQKESRVNINYDIVSSQERGGINNSGMEGVKVHGVIWNSGDKEAKNVIATLTFTDIVHDKVVRQIVVEDVDLFPNGESSAEFDAGYLRELTTSKTLVNKTIQIDWMEDNQLKSITIQLGDGVNKGKL